MIFYNKINNYNINKFYVVGHTYNEINSREIFNSNQYIYQINIFFIIVVS